MPLKKIEFYYIKKIRFSQDVFQLWKNSKDSADSLKNNHNLLNSENINNK